MPALLAVSILAGALVFLNTPRTPSGTGPAVDGAEAFSWLGTREGVGLVNVYGVIQFREDMLPFGGQLGADQTVKQLKEMREDSRVKAVVLRVNSPGGTVAASQEIHDQVKALVEAKKPVVVSMADMAASGGYYISAPASWIIANPGTITGSIGVVTQLMKYHEVADKIGISFPTFHKGEWKDMGSPSRPFREGEAELFQTLVDRAWEQFVGAVHDGRARRDDPEEAGKTPAQRPIRTRDDVEKLATGQIFTGAEALANGLVDQLGGLEDAVRKAGSLVGIEDPKIIRPKPAGLAEILGGISATDVKVQLPFAPERLGSPILYMMPR